MDRRNRCTSCRYTEQCNEPRVGPELLLLVQKFGLHENVVCVCVCEYIGEYIYIDD